MLPGAARVRLLGEQVGAERRAAVHHGGAGSVAGAVPCRDRGRVSDRGRGREQTLPAAPPRCGAAADAASGQFCFSLPG